MKFNNYIGKRVYYEKKHLLEKAKVKPIFYTIQVLLKTKKDEYGKTYLTKEDFDKIGLKYKNKTNIFLKTKWFFQTMWKNFIIWKKTRKFKTTKEIADYRINICNKCPNLTKNRTCELCGCFMDQKVKLIDVSCPDNPPRW